MLISRNIIFENDLYRVSVVSVNEEFLSIEVFQYDSDGRVKKAVSFCMCGDIHSIG